MGSFSTLIETSYYLEHTFIIKIFLQNTPLEKQLSFQVVFKVYLTVVAVAEVGLRIKRLTWLGAYFKSLVERSWLNLLANNLVRLG